jgi:CxxC motif-containing protein (DUF1111 family)
MTTIMTESVRRGPTRGAKTTKAGKAVGLLTAALATAGVTLLVLPGSAAAGSGRPSVSGLGTGPGTVYVPSVSSAAARPTDAVAAREAPRGLGSNGHLPTGSVDDAAGAGTFYAAMKIFDQVEVRADGLGPVYNAQSCRECHQSPASGGASQVTVLRAGTTRRGEFLPHPGGSLIQDRAIDPSLQEIVELEGNRDAVTALRLSLSILGDGYIEAVPDQSFYDIAAAQPPEQRGEIVLVDVLEAPGVQRVGRFGWKSQHASLLSFAADAYLNEMGITSPLFPDENTSNGRSVAAFDDVADPEEEASPSQPFGVDVHIFADFSRSLMAPPRDENAAANAAAQSGGELFRAVGCEVCHTSTLETAPAGTLLNGGTFTVTAALGSRRVHPYSDYLLHDIGIGDGIHQTGSDAARNKMRTAPLWGLAMRNRYMHDGASFTLQDAIRRHAGQAEQARLNFERLPREDRERILAFIRAL